MMYLFSADGSKPKTKQEEQAVFVSQLVYSIFSAVLSLLIIVFFHKILFGMPTNCTIPWWGFGVVLYILSIIYFVMSVIAIIMNATAVSKLSCSDQRR